MPVCGGWPCVKTGSGRKGRVEGIRYSHLNAFPCSLSFSSSRGVMLDIARIKAISLDLDDTLWPIWPTIERAEKVLHDWLGEHAPMAAALFSSPSALREIRDYMQANRPELKSDLSAVRRESIRLALYRAGENPLMADEAFEVFF